MTLDEDTYLGLKLVGDISGNFLVPDYQRGYRWGEEQVSLLLQDIWDNGDRNYCLQPIVVKQRADGRLELIDGQQRLTTLYLILLYMKKESLQNFEIPFTIEYETRPRSRAYLDILDESQREENVDFFHMFGAYHCIKTWFDAHGAKRQHVANKFFGYLYDRVKVIWYEASSKVDSTALFTRLNVGRIPLTNAELVKALLLKKCPPPAEQHASSLPPDRHRQIEIAAQWDLIERDMHDRSFWAFLTNRKEQEYQTRIELIFDMMAGPKAAHENFQTFFFFKEQIETHENVGNPDPRGAVWSCILERYYLLKEWYEDRDLYHKVGYLVAVGGSMSDLIDVSKEKTKSAFCTLLDDRIRETLDMSREDVEELTYKQWNDANQALLLFNVETVRSLRNSFDRYPFHEHKLVKIWSLEHIHAQNTEQLNKKEQWQEWLREHRDALKEIRLLDSTLEVQRQSLLDRIDASYEGIDRESFDQLVPIIMVFFDPATEVENMHSISNLALLSGGTNSSLSNSVFEVKRRKALELDRAGEYIPICTRRVFLKYYTNAGDHQIHIWSAQDRKCYLDAMISPVHGVLTPYLKPSLRSPE